MWQTTTSTTTLWCHNDEREAFRHSCDQLIAKPNNTITVKEKY
jgi:hypothetical protein